MSRSTVHVTAIVGLVGAADEEVVDADEVLDAVGPVDLEDHVAQGSGRVACAQGVKAEAGDWPGLPAVDGLGAVALQRRLQRPGEDGGLRPGVAAARPVGARPVDGRRG